MKQVVGLFIYNQSMCCWRRTKDILAVLECLFLSLSVFGLYLRENKNKNKSSFLSSSTRDKNW